jgi:ERCC4-type nuclease
LLLDHREVGASRQHAARGALVADLAKRLGEDAVEARSLPIGDVLWIWRDTDISDGGMSCSEFIAGWVIERKTFHDLSSSIMDGRYDEQKVRLLEAPGLDGVVYLIEGAGPLFGVGESSAVDSGLTSQNRRGFGQRLISHMLPTSTLSTTAAHTQFISGFHVIHSTSTSHTLTLLADLHDVLSSRGPPLQEHSPELVHYRDFAERTRKSCHARIFEAFGRMLRMVPHCGPETTEALIDEFQTPHALATALRERSDKELLLHLKERRGGRAPVTAATLAACREMFT